ncbi:hypothetical protein [Methylomonas rapida]|uniref:Uncharacterized protein n=1 Tax=Methylomonas rapida TaxID=2963939 RepID=A0ABY7GH46_9GAMM|nr:hypothetical protein [Methylomonas rapida]WAR44574.1 hypothetical protein NM686_019845 [Methylomonas rapida]
MSAYDQALMETMRTTVIGNVESVTRYSIDADSKGGAIWVTKPNTGKNSNVLGNEIIKVKMPFDMFPQIQAMQESGDITLPQVMEILCDVDMGGQNKAVLSAVSIRKYIPETNTKPADKKPAVNESKPLA